MFADTPIISAGGSWWFIFLSTHTFVTEQQHIAAQWSDQQRSENREHRARRR